MDRPKYRIAQLLTKTPLTIKNILIVGAGGIGCELIKNLYKTQHNITLIDYDTIAQTNLNRQFCFRKEDIGKYKVQVLKQYFTTLNPQFKLTIQTDNIYNYDELYFSQFNILISALDNNEARQYLNQMAIDHNIPLIDAGTAGYNGQCQCFIRFESQCRMCRPQPTENISYAVCSMRGKPQRNVHCVQFGVNFYGVVKELGKWLKKGRSNRQVTDQWDSLYSYFVKSIELYSQAELEDICVQIHDLLFYKNIQNLHYQQTNPIKYPTDQTIIINLLKNKQPDTDIITFLSQPESQFLLLQKQLPTQFYSYLFVRCLTRILQIPPVQEYDKDNFQSSLFVYSVTCLRIGNFREVSDSKLRSMCYYQCKDISGKIIPAIASTNSIAAALQVLLVNQLDATTNVDSYLSIKGYHSQNKVQKYCPYKPKAGCLSCSALYNYIEIQVDMSSTTWGELEQFFIVNLDDSLKDRDLRVNQFVIVRNLGRKWHTNKSRSIDFNVKLVKQSKIGRRMMVVKYVAGESQTCWKIVLVDVKNMEKKIKMRKEIDKKKIRQNVQKQIQKVQANRKIFHETSQIKLEDIVVLQEQV